VCQRAVKTTPATLEEAVALLGRFRQEWSNEKRHLELRIKSLEHRLFGSRSEKLPIEDQQLALIDEVFAQQEPAATQDVVVDPDIEKRISKKPVRRPLPAHLEVVEERLEPADKTCAHCGRERCLIREEAPERLSFENVVWVGADEMNRRKGHNYLTVFANLLAKRVLFATPGKDASVWEAFAAEMLRHNGHPTAIQYVTIDMSAAYIKGVSDNFGNAQVVYDKFHVIQNVVEACDQIRKIESRADAGKRDQLERTRWMWLKNRVNWTEKEAQKWESMALEHCVTGMAYEMRLVLQGIYQWKDVGEARKLFGNWCAWVQAMRERTGELL
jgi:hypothetical protein